MMAVAFVIPGMATQMDATPSYIENLVENNPIENELVEAILRYVSFETGLDYEHLYETYDSGELTIEKSDDGYLVTLAEVDGGILILIAEDIS